MKTQDLDTLSTSDERHDAIRSRALVEHEETGMKRLLGTRSFQLSGIYVTKVHQAWKIKGNRRQSDMQTVYYGFAQQYKNLFTGRYYPSHSPDTYPVCAGVRDTNGLIWTDTYEVRTQHKLFAPVMAEYGLTDFDSYQMGYFTNFGEFLDYAGILEVCQEYLKHIPTHKRRYDKRAVDCEHVMSIVLNHPVGDHYPLTEFNSAGFPEAALKRLLEKGPQDEGNFTEMELQALVVRGLAVRVVGAEHQTQVAAPETAARLLCDYYNTGSLEIALMKSNLLTRQEE